MSNLLFKTRQFKCIAPCFSRTVFLPMNNAELRILAIRTVCFSWLQQRGGLVVWGESSFFLCCYVVEL